MPMSTTFQCLATLARRILASQAAVLTQTTHDGEKVIAVFGIAKAERQRAITLANQVVRSGQSLVTAGTGETAFHVAMPLRDGTGAPVGGLVVLDNAPRQRPGEADLAALADLALIAGRLIETEAHAAHSARLECCNYLSERLLSAASNYQDVPTAISAITDAVIAATGAVTCQIHRLCPIGTNCV